MSDGRTLQYVVCHGTGSHGRWVWCSSDVAASAGYDSGMPCRSGRLKLCAEKMTLTKLHNYMYFYGTHPVMTYTQFITITEYCFFDDRK